MMKEIWSNDPMKYGQNEQMKNEIWAKTWAKHEQNKIWSNEPNDQRNTLLCVRLFLRLTHR